MFACQEWPKKYVVVFVEKKLLEMRKQNKQKNEVFRCTFAKKKTLWPIKFILSSMYLYNR